MSVDATLCELIPRLIFENTQRACQMRFLWTRIKHYTTKIVPSIWYSSVPLDVVLLGKLKNFCYT